MASSYSINPPSRPSSLSSSLCPQRLTAPPLSPSLNIETQVIDQNHPSGPWARPMRMPLFVPSAIVMEERVACVARISKTRMTAPSSTPILSVMCKPFPSLYPSMTVFHMSFRVIGLSDGLTVPFALTAGLSSLGESKLVVLGGVAELIAGAISMGVGGFLASQAERDHYRFLKRHISSRVLRSCEGEMEREVFAVLGPVGVDEPTSRAVTKCLRDMECDADGNGHGPSSSDEETQSLRWKSEVGLTPFLIKFGEGLGSYPSVVSECFIDLVFTNRGGADKSPIRVSNHDWTRVPYWRDHTTHPLLFLRPRPCSLDLLLHPDWFRASGLWGNQIQSNRGRPRSQRILVGCGEYITCRRSSCSCSICTRCTPQGMTGEVH